jgi:hypothetical protein
MFITKNNKLGFIHIPKTGGTSIEVAFLNLDKEVRRAGWEPISVLGAHSSYQDWEKSTQERKYYGRSNPDKWFTIVRHPIARMQSYYYYQIKYDKMRLSGEKPLKFWTREQFKKRIEIFESMGIDHVAGMTQEFIDEIINAFPDDSNWKKSATSRGIMKPQGLFIQGCKNIRVFKLEKIDKCYDWLHAQGAPVEYTHAKSSGERSQHWSKELRPDTIDRIIEWYKDDIKQFKYTSLLQS